MPNGLKLFSLAEKSVACIEFGHRSRSASLHKTWSVDMKDAEVRWVYEEKAVTDSHVIM